MRLRFEYLGILWAVIPLAFADRIAAQTSRAEPEGNRYVKVRLTTGTASLPPGQSSVLGVVFDISEGWHLYWRNPGDSGLPPKVKLKLPAGVVAGEARWPAPKRHLQEGDVLDYIYEKQLVLLYPLDVSKSVPPGQVTVEADIDWLVCREKCVPGRVHVKQTFTIAGSIGPSADAQLLQSFEARVPRPLDGERPIARIRWNGWTMVIEAAKATRLVFFPYENTADIYPLDLPRSGQSSSESLHLTYTDQVKKIGNVCGVLAVSVDGKTSSYEIKCPVPEQPTSGDGATKPTGGHP